MGMSKINSAKNCNQWGLRPGPLDHHADAVQTEQSQHLVVSRNL